ncbi:MULTISPECIES: hypothetical protein [Pseudomonas fluorescens group]|uniref:Uncharacterized protein n=1 Tax=Pseudomonas fluorescens TaxID=294 RepID=A0AAE2U4T6_PSEFL|nr:MULTISPECIES: hypothetical protein [Pseudomonas fluorescens group]AZE87040.1 transport permease protein of gamma-aminobutyrate [Pseudomonas orientalis]MBD8270473.1 hypothetical protein [Pseudomonas fluorescens]
MGCVYVVCLELRRFDPRQCTAAGELFLEARWVEIIATGILSLLVVLAGLFVASRRKAQKAGAPVLN